MSELNYFVLHANGDFGALHIGEADDDEIFEMLLKVFKTNSGPFFDNYECSTMCTFSADDVSIVADSDGATDIVMDFQKELGGFGFELFGCWHMYGKALFQLGVYEKNSYLSGGEFDNIYGPLVVRAQVLRDDIAVEVPVSTALYVAEMILKAKGDSIDSIFELLSC